MDKIKEQLLKNKFVILGILLVLVIIIGTSYAFLSTTANGNSKNVLRAGNLSLKLDETATNGILINPAYPLTNQEGINDTPKYTFTLENNGNITADYTIYLDDITEAAKKMGYEIIRFNLKKQMYDSSNSLKANQPADRLDLLSNARSATSVVLDAGTLDAGEKNVYTLNLWMDYDAGNEYQGSAFKGQIRIEGAQQYKKVEVAYTYNQTTGASNYCVTGNENTCVETTCYKTKTAGSCPAGTIIKYKVNDTTTETFHVMYDDASTITMQSQKNTVYNIAWYSPPIDNSRGPLTILPALEAATSSWTNVNDQTYTMGTTTFPVGDNNQFPSANSGTSCTPTSCSGNKYTLDSRTAKSRMITVQETVLLGCTDTHQSCPVWMNNYLYQSTNNGGTVDDNEVRNNSYNYGYWTMSAWSSDTVNARIVSREGNVDYYSTVNTFNGARAVVVVNK